MRCWALYNDKRILRGLSAGLFFTILLSIILVKITMDKVVYIANPFPSVFTGCVILLPSTMWMLYVVPLIYDSTMFIMTVLRIYVLSSEYGATPLMERLAENGALHSGVLVVLMMFSCIGGTVETVKIAANGSGGRVLIYDFHIVRILGAISSVVCSRIIFSLHTLAEDEANKRLPFSEDKDTSGDIRFAVPLHELSNSSSTSYGSVPFK
ncbi:hypothetical protein FRC09_015951 [Ceratobasidium sp. 395]|nr:hypothetical protein FRC09_015951 [Ceratobasidium sp. 395]